LPSILAIKSYKSWIAVSGTLSVVVLAVFVLAVFVLGVFALAEVAPPCAG
jgi:hypothetical protein